VETKKKKPPIAAESRTHISIHVATLTFCRHSLSPGRRFDDDDVVDMLIYLKFAEQST